MSGSQTPNEVAGEVRSPTPRRRHMCLTPARHDGCLDPVHRSRMRPDVAPTLSPPASRAHSRPCPRRRRAAGRASSSRTSAIVHLTAAKPTCPVPPPHHPPRFSAWLPHLSRMQDRVILRRPLVAHRAAFHPLAHLPHRVPRYVLCTRPSSSAAQCGVGRTALVLTRPDSLLVRTPRTLRRHRRCEDGAREIDCRLEVVHRESRYALRVISYSVLPLCSARSLEHAQGAVYIA